MPYAMPAYAMPDAMTTDAMTTPVTTLSPLRPLVLRPARAEDLPHLAKLIAAFAAEHPDPLRLDEATLIDLVFADAPWAQLIVAEAEGLYLGYAVLTGTLGRPGGRTGLSLRHLFVRADHRGHGIGRALLTAAQEAAATLGPAARLSVSPATLSRLHRGSAPVEFGFRARRAEAVALAV
ncbi:GNAT family N-acetyltransferase [Celeribacter indicus]|uniref:Acetyltransferase n=1 Tax=Celeribacter indicus TaxID=1208324 RepID=A0A0B5DUY0_9RHOB|nr:GNAT family N-acetyltransferase [Celeribacter indicus]AJE47203.1 acetyltransferase [Celeribacter indicus]SDW00563.1 Acetyltransferase (GNAT) domain-containing protein [Celeribacter indicus]